MALDPKKWTVKTQEAFAAAIGQAKAKHNPELTPDHLLVALTSQDGTIVAPMLAKLGQSPGMVRDRALGAVDRLPSAVGGDEPRVGRELNTVADRAELLRAAGADRVVVLRTTPELLALSPGEFFGRILRDGLAAKVVVEGYNFRFGRGRSGTVEELRTLCRAAGMGFAVVSPFPAADGSVSSSRVRSSRTGEAVNG